MGQQCTGSSHSEGAICKYRPKPPQDTNTPSGCHRQPGSQIPRTPAPPSAALTLTARRVTVSMRAAISSLCSRAAMTCKGEKGGQYTRWTREGRGEVKVILGKAGGNRGPTCPGSQLQEPPHTSTTTNGGRRGATAAPPTGCSHRVVLLLCSTLSSFSNSSSSTSSLYLHGTAQWYRTAQRHTHHQASVLRGRGGHPAAAEGRRAVRET